MHTEMDARTSQSETLASRFSDTFATPPPASCEQPVVASSEVVPSVPPPPDTVRDLAALADAGEADGPDSLLTDWLDRPSPVPEAIEEIARPIARTSPPGWSLLAAACAVVGAATLMVGLSRPPAASPIVVSKVVTTSAPSPAPSASASASTASAPATSAASTASAPARPSQAHRTAPAPKVAPRVRPFRGNAETAAPAPKSSSLYGRD